jgi:hypothetical protein
MIALHEKARCNWRSVVCLDATSTNILYNDTRTTAEVVRAKYGADMCVGIFEYNYDATYERCKTIFQCHN